MPSGKSLFDFTVFKKTVGRFWPIAAIYLALWLLILPLNFLFDMPSTQDEFAVDINYASESILPFAVIFCVFSAMAAFSHLYSHRSANFFGSLPIRREGLFITHYLAGLSLTIVPNVITAMLSAFMGAIGGVVDIPSVLLWLTAACGDCFFLYSLAVFCGMFTGHIIALPVFYGIANSIFISIFAIIESVLDIFYYGFVSIDYRLQELIMWFTPISRLYYVNVDNFRVSLPNGQDSTIPSWLTLAIYAAAAVVLTVSSLLIYRKRKLENAGNVVAVDAMRPLFRYGVSFFSGLFFGFFIGIILNNETAMMIAMVICAAAGCFVAQMILDKSFRVFRKWRGPLVMAGIFCVMLIVVIFDLTGFETRIPKLSDVTSVEIDYLRDDWDMYGTRVSDIELTDPKQIQYILTLHQTAIDQRNTDRIDGSQQENIMLDFSLTYHTKFGDISRAYDDIFIYPAEINRENSGAWAFNQLYSDKELYARICGLDKLRSFVESGGTDIRAEYYFFNGGNSVQPEEKYEYFQHGNSLEILRRSDVMSIIDAVEADFEQGNIGVRQFEKHSDSAVTRQITITYFLDDETLPHQFDMTLPDTAENTIRAIREALPDALEDGGYYPETQSPYYNAFFD